MDTTNWTKVKLGDIATFINGMAFKPSDWSESGYPIIRIQNLTDKNAESNRYNGYVDTKYIINDGDILFSWSGTIDVFKYHGEKAVLNQHIFKVLPKGGNDLQFIAYLIKQSIPKMLEDSHGSTMKHLTKGTVENCEVMVPSLEVQIKIANAISTLDFMIWVGGMQMQDIMEQKQQLMSEIFNSDRESTWKTVKVKDVFDIKRGYVLKASDVSKDADEIYKYPVYSSQTLNDGLMGYWKEFLYSDAITWTTDGAYAGTVKFREGPFYCTNVCGVLLPKVNSVDSKFAAYILSIIAPNHVVKVGNPKLMNNVMAEIEFQLPPIEEQRRIARILSEYDELISANDTKLENLRKSKNQLMNNIFAERMVG